MIPSIHLHLTIMHLHLLNAEVNITQSIKDGWYQFPADVRLDYCLEWCSLQALSKHTCKYATIPHFPHSTPNDLYAQPSSYSSGMTNHTPSHVVSHNWSCQIKSPPSVKFNHAPSHVVSHDWVMTSSHDPNHQSQLWPFVVRPTHHPDME